MTQKTFVCILTSILILSLPTTSQATSLNIAGVRINKKVKNMKQLKSKNIVHQSLDFSCGAAGVSTLLNFYYKDTINEVDIINALLQITPLEKVQERRGFSLLDLKKFLEHRGYTATGYKMDFEFLRELGRPALVPIKFKNYRHFVIIKGVYADRVFISDPALGNMTMKTANFKKIWTNNIGLVVENRTRDGVEIELDVELEDVRVVDYARMRQLIDQTAVRTRIFTNEY